MTYQPYPIRGPWKGVVSDFPAPFDPQALDVCDNWLCRKGRLLSRPYFSSLLILSPDELGLKLVSYEDAADGIHTLLLTNIGAYHLDPSTNPFSFKPLTLPSGVTSLQGNGLPYGAIVSQNKVLFTNGSVPLLYADGEQTLKATADAPGGSLFLTEQASHIIMANTWEPALNSPGAVNYPQRVRWSKSGDPTVWTGDFTAGFADLLDVPDNITGMVSTGPVTSILRTNGLTLMYPTGNGLAPFSFEHLSYGEEGAGNGDYPYSLAAFADFGIFLGSAGFYRISSGQVSPLPCGALTDVFNDLLNSSGGTVTGHIVPSMGAPFDFLSYWLCIPQSSGGGKVWVMNINSGAWQRFVYSSWWGSSVDLAYTE